MQRRIIGATLGRRDGRLTPPRLLTLLARSGILTPLPARLVGVGIRPEHIQTRELA